MTPIPDTGPVVMVDDNDGDVWLARHCMRSAGMQREFLSFSNGPAFLAYLEQVKRGEAPMPAVVLLDVNMPGMTGHDVLRAARSDPAFTDLPIFVMLTSSTDPRDRSTALANGASGFMTKPGQLADYVAFFQTLAA